MRWMKLTFALLVGGVDARAAIVLNEVLYDPPGPDAGAEFVELYHDGDDARSLAGHRLLFLNGSDPSRPVVVWSALPTDRIAARSFFVIGGELVEPRDATTSASLQNGPDALQLWHDELLLDAVAWGEVEGLGEGAPAPDVASTSLGRIPDGADTADNAADWFALPEPTPGAPNLQPSVFSLDVAEVDPPWRLEAGPASVGLRAVATGSDPRQTTRLRAWLDDALILDEELTAARGDTIPRSLELDLHPGRHRLRVHSRAGDDTMQIALQCGLTDVVLNEVLARPEAGDPEWIELRSLASASHDLTGWAIADAGRQARRLSEGAWLPAAGYALVSQDCSRLDVSEATCWELQGGWLTLNNSATGEGWADEVLLLDPEGAVVDWAPYDDRLQPGTGTSMERSILDDGRSAVWFASPGRPTPGQANVTSGASVPRRGLEVSPNPFSPDGDGADDILHVVLRVNPSVEAAFAEVVDLTGETVRRLGDASGGDLLQWIWDGLDARGRPVAMGAYVIAVRAPTVAKPWRALVALGRRR